MNQSFLSPRNRTSSSSSFAWRVCKLTLFLAVVGAAVWLLIQQQIHQRLSSLVEQKLNEKVAAAGLVAEVGHAQFFDHQGLRLGNLKFGFRELQSRPTRSHLEVYELFAHLDASMSDLATTEVKPTAIELKRAKLTLVRDQDGSWDFEPLIESLKKLSFDGEAGTPVLLSDCEVQIVDLAKPNVKPIQISGIQFSMHSIEHQGRTLLQLDGEFQTRAISKMKVTAYLDSARQVWQASLTANQARLSRELLDLLPSSMAADVEPLKTLVGTIEFAAKINGDMSLKELPQFVLNGSINGFSVDDERLPLPVTNAQATFLVNNDGLAIQNASGGFGDTGQFRGNYWQSGLLQRAGWHADGTVNGFRFDERERLVRWLPEYCVKFCEDYSPNGISDVTFDLTFDGEKLKRRLDAKIKDMSFSFIKMPYQVDHCMGLVTWVDKRCDFDVRSNVGNQPVRLHGFADNIGDKPTYRVDIDVPGSLPIDQKMLDAVDAQPKLAKVIRAFNPTGRVGGTGRLEKTVPGGEVQRTFDVKLKRCEVRHNGFDYPIYNVTGDVKVRGNDYSFVGIRGTNSSGVVGCNGSWNPEEGLKLRFLCDSVPLNDQLKYALKPDIRSIWEGFRPRGTLDFLKVDMTLPPNTSNGLQIALEADLKGANDDAEANYVSIYPVWFPYQINHLTGKIKIADGKISLTDIAGQHQKTWLACNGQGHYSPQSWSLRLKDLLVSSLKVDEYLLAAVPSALAPALGQLRYEGLLTVHGEITLAGSKSNELSSNDLRPGRVTGDPFSNYRPAHETTYQPAASKTSMAWNLRLDMSQANMQIGLPIKNVFGAVELTGLYDGETLNCDGQLDVDSMNVYDVQLTDVKGPLRIENDRVLAGYFAGINRTEPQSNLSPVSGTTSDSVTGKLHGGLVRLDAQLDSANQNEFYVQATLADSCLATACRELAPELENVEGHSFAAIKLRGNGSGTHSHRGVGSVQLRDAKIYELPVFFRC